MGITAENLLTVLIKENYALHIYKHYIMHIIKIIFDRMISENYQFKIIIDNNYNDIYQKINLETSQLQIQKHLLNLIKSLQKYGAYINKQLDKKNIITKVLWYIDANYTDPNLSL